MMMNRGFAPVLIAIGIVSVLAAMSLTNSMTAGIANSRQIKRLNRIEGFYTGELAAWHHVLRTKEGLTGEESGNTINIDNRYVDTMDWLPPDSYDPTPGAAMNVTTTRDFAPTKSLIRRYSDAAVRYLASVDNPNSFCGRTQFGKKNVGVCLAGKPKPSGGTPCSVIAKADPALSTCTNNLYPGCNPSCNNLGYELFKLPIQMISNQSELQAIRANGHYKLKNDIQLDATFQPLGDLPGARTANGGMWAPYYSDIVLDGDGFSIVGFSYTAAPNEKKDIGLFRYLYNGVIQNLTLQNVSIQSDAADTAGVAVGAIVGRAYSSVCIYNVHAVNGSVTGSYQAGGLVGISAGSDLLFSSSNLTVKTFSSYPTSSYKAGGLVGNTSATAMGSSQGGLFYGSSFCGHVSISSNGGGEVGGIVGFTNSPKIERCFSEGTVANHQNKFVLGTFGIAGGIVGRGATIGVPVINQCLSKARVLSSYAAGGILGMGGSVYRSFWIGADNPTDAGNPGLDCNFAGIVGSELVDYEITDSFAAGFRKSSCPPGHPSIRGIAPNSTYDRTKNGYFDSESLGTSLGWGTALTTAQMKDQSSFQGWDFVKTWKMQANGYPILRWMEESSQ